MQASSSTSAAVDTTYRARNSFYGRTPPKLPKSKTEIEVLIEHHRFIRNVDEQDLSWEDRLAKKTYDQLFKDLALCDLSRWKEGKVAMRWRTAGEVLDGKGDVTCANLKCKHHTPSSSGQVANEFGQQQPFISLDGHPQPSLALQTLQTQFGYVEDGTRKIAEVKLNLCSRCTKKMNKMKPSEASSSAVATGRTNDHPDRSAVGPSEKSQHSRRSKSDVRSHGTSPRRRNSRSTSPRRQESRSKRSRHSPSPSRPHQQATKSDDAGKINICSTTSTVPKFEPYQSTIAQWNQKNLG
ncbi:hypothetical protein CROQUDRAFT_669853 [Cronartium quercuum f. sp. fusiforme G11]|uniref:Uncharacterized protein n=1 Tax=Cronartium quercuum f. sp. fusiforme G11 TaxID=708437 RepID=A0A9P6NK28_9BASI|nr:hypothetical protein CROQUDRAFT_669853 [Cronartium quercuum f. sp. fusiforme G11]